MSKPENTFTRFVEAIVVDTKDLLDDILDRAKGLETDVCETVKGAVNGDETAALTRSSGPAPSTRR